jgi:predicted PurR-regulated permease PerM
VWAERAPGDLGDGVLRAGRYAWAALGIVVLTVLAWMALSYVGFVVVPLVLALFPAAALLPAVEWLVRRRVPRAVAALLVVLGVLAVLVGVIAGLVPLVADQVPAVADAVSRAAGQLEQTLRRLPFDVGVSSLRELATRVAGGGGGGMLGGTLSVTAGVVEFLAGTLLLLVALFCYLQDGPRMARSALGLLQERTRELVREIGCRAWVTLGGYFRGLLLVAAVDAVSSGPACCCSGCPSRCRWPHWCSWARCSRSSARSWRPCWPRWWHSPTAGSASRWRCSRSRWPSSSSRATSSTPC